MWIELAKFYKLNAERIVRCKYGNILVALHLRFTPNTSTGNVLTEIALEQLRLFQRRNEQRCHTLFDSMVELGKRIDPEQEWLVKSDNLNEPREVIKNAFICPVCNTMFLTLPIEGTCSLECSNEQYAQGVENEPTSGS